MSNETVTYSLEAVLTRKESASRHARSFCYSDFPDRLCSAVRQKAEGAIVAEAGRGIPAVAAGELHGGAAIGGNLPQVGDILGSILVQALHHHGQPAAVGRRSDGADALEGDVLFSGMGRVHGDGRSGKGAIVLERDGAAADWPPLPHRAPIRVRRSNCVERRAARCARCGRLGVCACLLPAACAGSQRWATAGRRGAGRPTPDSQAESRSAFRLQQPGAPGRSGRRGRPARLDGAVADVLAVLTAARAATAPAWAAGSVNMTPNVWS